MRTTLDLPDALYREAKKAAVERGITLKALLTRCVHKELHPQAEPAGATEPSWRKHVGTLGHEAAEEMRVFLANADFSKVDPEDRA